jgi:DNA-binding transcriptional MerR regulator
MTKPKRRVGGPACKPGEPVLTASGIAEALRQIAPDTAGTVQKVRYWTREEVLLPVAQGHAGTGKHRRYAESAAFDAAVLFAAARAGLNIAAHRHLVDALTLARWALPTWQAARRQGHTPPLFLKILQTDGRTEHAVDEHFPKPADEAIVCLDLGRLWSKVLI